MTYYVAQNLAFPSARAPAATSAPPAQGYLVPAYLVAAAGASRRPTAPAPRPLPPLPPTPVFDYPYRRYKQQPLSHDQLRFLIQQHKHKQLLQLLQEERRLQQLRLQEEQQANIYQLEEERRAKQLHEQRLAKQLQEERIAKLQEERIAKLQQERIAKLQEERIAKLQEERIAKQLEEERIAKLQEERIANQIEEERRAKQLQLYLEEEQAKLEQSRSEEQTSAAAQRQQYDALLQSHNEQELANSIAATPSPSPPPALVQITPPKSASKLVQHLAATLHKSSSNELQPAVSAAHFELSVKSVLRLLAALQRAKAPGSGAGVGKGAVGRPSLGPSRTKAGVITQTFPAPTVEGSTPGRPGIDYPAYDTIPTTSFSCQTQRYKGFFGDPETNCQVLIPRTNSIPTKLTNSIPTSVPRCSRVLPFVAKQDENRDTGHPT